MRPVRKCACNCGIILTGKQARFASDKCRQQYWREARIRADRARAKRESAEEIDIGSMTPQERLGLLCAAAVKWGVMQ